MFDHHGATNPKPFRWVAENLHPIFSHEKLAKRRDRKPMKPGKNQIVNGCEWQIYFHITMENHHFLMGTSTISMVVFNSYVKLPEGRCYKNLTMPDLRGIVRRDHWRRVHAAGREDPHLPLTSAMETYDKMALEAEANHHVPIIFP